MKVPSLALIVHVLLHAQHRHHGQMSVIPKMSLEWGQRRDGITHSRQGMKQMPGIDNDGKGKAKAGTSPAATGASPGWLQGGLAMGMMHPMGRGWSKGHNLPL